MPRTLYLASLLLRMVWPCLYPMQSTICASYRPAWVACIGLRDNAEDVVSGMQDNAEDVMSGMQDNAEDVVSGIPCDRRKDFSELFETNLEAACPEVHGGMGEACPEVPQLGFPVGGVWSLDCLGIGTNVKVLGSGALDVPVS